MMLPFLGTSETHMTFVCNRCSPSAQLVDTTVELANKVGAAEIISRIVDDLKDEAEQYRKMVMETIEKIMGNLGAADIDHKLEEQLIDGILYAFQEQTTEVRAMMCRKHLSTACKVKQVELQKDIYRPTIFIFLPLISR